MGRDGSPEKIRDRRSAKEVARGGPKKGVEAVSGCREKVFSGNWDRGS